MSKTESNLLHFKKPKSDNIPIGYTKINIDESYDLGYGLKKEFWHKGIVFEACKAIVQQAKFDGIPYITATHDINNPRSGNVMKRLGMQYQYSYLEQWQPKTILKLKYETPDDMKIPGIEYYKAVIEDGITTFHDFLKWRNSQNHSGIIEWCP